VLRGAAGNGKSRLARWIGERAHELGVATVWKALHSQLGGPGDGLARMLARQLERWGHEVTATCDGAEAWDAYQKEVFDVVVCDWEMPEIDGVELIDRIRSAKSHSYVYIIMLTGRTETEDVVRGIESGADDFLTKPFEKAELEVRLRPGYFPFVEPGFELRTMTLVAPS